MGMSEPFICYAFPFPSAALESKQESLEQLAEEKRDSYHERVYVLVSVKWVETLDPKIHSLPEFIRSVPLSMHVFWWNEPESTKER